MRVLVTGGCGYIGSVLVPKLQAVGHDVYVIDVGWFGLKSDAPVVCADIRDMGRLDLSPYDAIIHLAAVANDPHGELDPKLTWEVNALATMRLAEQAARQGVERFIYASSGSVYGVSDRPQVTENTPLDPITEYNKTKMVAERCVWSYTDFMYACVVRPATVCGYSPRQRLDVLVNRCVIEALTTGKVKVFGGEQMRPHIHIDDMADLYVWLLGEGQCTATYNAGFENLSVREVAQKVVNRIGGEIVETPSADPRSYRMNSDRLLKAGFKPKKTVDDAIEDLIAAHAAGLLKDEDKNYNIRVMTRDSIRRAA